MSHTGERTGSTRHKVALTVESSHDWPLYSNVTVLALHEPQVSHPVFDFTPSSNVLAIRMMSSKSTALAAFIEAAPPGEVRSDKASA